VAVLIIQSFAAFGWTYSVSYNDGVNTVVRVSVKLKYIAY